jgi:hypothetical protein
MAHNHAGAAEIGGLMLNRYGGTDDPETALEISLPLLVVTGATSDTAENLEVADRAVANLRGSMRGALLAGISAYRRGFWAEARDALVPPAANRDGRTAAIAGFFLAMTEHRDGRELGAADALAQANRRLEATLRSGDLGNTIEPETEWTLFAAAIIARDEGEILLHGELVSHPIDAAYLAQNRAAWEPIKLLLEQANWAARRRDWAQASELFLQATRHDRFDWTAATHQVRGLEEKIACLLVLGRQWEEYNNQCNSLAGGLDRIGTGSLTSLLLSPDHPSMPLKGRALEMARWRRDASVRRQASPSEQAWHNLALGMAEYRNGHFAEALAALEVARGAFNLNCAGTANAFAALAEWQLGHKEAAKRHLQAAEAALKQVVDGSHGDLGNYWTATATLEIALNEARSRVR